MTNGANGRDERRPWAVLSLAPGPSLTVLPRPLTMGRFMIGRPHSGIPTLGSKSRLNQCFGLLATVDLWGNEGQRTLSTHRDDRPDWRGIHSHGPCSRSRGTNQRPLSY